MTVEGRLLVVSAHDEQALEGRIAALQAVLLEGRLDITDTAFTLATARRAFPHRASLLLPAPAAENLASDGATGQIDRAIAHASVEVAMMFPGQGSQFVGMGRELYEHNAHFRAVVDACDAIVSPLLDRSLRSLLFDEDPDGSRSELLKQTSIAQPALFVIEYALASLLQEFGVVPHVLIGHSIGEYAAACIAGVFERSDALRLVVRRGQLMQSMPRGSMLAVRARPDVVSALLEAHSEVTTLVSLAAHNAPELSVVSGPSVALDAFAQYLSTNRIESSPLHTSHAFHSAMMDPILEEFAAEVAKVESKPPRIPIVSGLTGKLLTAEQACSAAYWAAQLRHTVQFSQGVQTIGEQPGRVLLEVGPGTALMTSAAKQTTAHPPLRLLETLGHPKSNRPGFEATLRCLGRLWSLGVPLDFQRLYDAPRRKLVRLPTYPFTRSRHWTSVPKDSHTSPSAHTPELSAIDPALVTATASSELTTQSMAPLKVLLEGRLGRTIEAGEWQRSFVEIGFDSLALTQLSAKLNEVFRLRIPFRHFFDDVNSPELLGQHLIREGKLTQGAQAPLANVQTMQREMPPRAATGSGSPPVVQSEFAALTERLERIERLLESLLRSPHASLANRSKTSVDAPSKPAETSPARFEPTTAQREIWVASNVGGTSATLAYNECRSIAFTGRLNVTALVAALNTLVERHEALRQTLSADGAWCTTAKPLPLTVNKIDLRSLTADAKVGALEELKVAQVATPFELTQGPLLRAELVQLDDEQHALQLCAHHIVVDGYSFGVLTRELAELYSALVEERTAKLAPADSFAAYAAHTQATDASSDQNRALQHWLTHLSGHSVDLTLPTDSPRPANRSYDATRLDFALSETLVAKLRQQATATRVSTQTLLMSAFQVLLHAVTRQNDIVLGVPTSGQAIAGLDALVGHCVHVLPIRTQLETNDTFDAHARRLNQTMMDGLTHQQTTFTELLEHLNRPRDPSRIPLIPVAFGMGRSLKRPSFSDLAANLSVVPRKSESFELYVYVTEDGNGLEVSWSYNTGLFEAATIEHWHRCFKTILEGLATLGTQQRLSDIDVLDPSDRQQILARSRGPQPPIAPFQSVAARIAAIATSYPEHTAVIDAAAAHTYRALDQRANQVAHLLRTLIQEPNGLVAVCLERSVELVSSLLGVWRAGLGYIPLDPNYPVARIEMILEDSRAHIVLTSRALAERTPSHVQRVFIEDHEDTIESLPTSAPEVLPAPTDTAYVIFTSGSTGRPKGVVIQQRAFENFILSMQQEPGFVSSDCLLAITTVSFDIAGLELFLPLTVGGSLVLATREQSADPQALRSLLAKHPVTVMQATPASWQMLFDSGWLGSPGLKALCGGEALPQHLAERFISVQVELWNVYGPTETTVWSTVKRIEDARKLTIGKPIANTTLYVLDERNALLPAGTAGDLWIGGQGVALGYLGRPDLTNERFIPSPFDTNERLYKTGDLARLRHDGEFECLGRADFQVKIRGYRIELGEIETAILNNPKVTAAVVVAREVTPGEKALIAYVVTLTGSTIDVSDLRTELSGQLPGYMVPSVVCVLNALPMTPNNKVDRNALPAPTVDSGYRAPEHLVRQDPSQHVVHQTWRNAPLNDEALPPQVWLVLVDDAGVGESLGAQLEQSGHIVTRVYSRDRFHEKAANEFSVNPELGREELEHLVDRLEELGRIPDRIVHLWLLQDEVSHRPGSSLYHRHQEHGLYTLLHLAKGLAAQAKPKTVVHHVVGGFFGDALNADQRARSTILGACRTIPNEFERQQVRAIDVGLKTNKKAKKILAAQLVQELLRSETEPEVRYTGGLRQVPTWSLQQAPVKTTVAGAALIVGLTEQSLASARFLATKGVPVALLSDESAAPELRSALTELLATEVVKAAFTIGATNQPSLGTRVNALRSQFGPIHTLVVSAATAPTLALTSLREQEVEASVAFEAARLQELEQLLPTNELRLTVIHTTLDARLGSPGRVADAIITAFLEPRSSQAQGRRVICHWGPLHRDSSASASNHVTFDSQYFAKLGLTAAELDAAHERIWSSEDGSLVITPFEFSAYRDRLTLSAAKDASNAARRPFIEPTTPTERRVAHLWSDALRLERVSIRDSFFDLGGHSLLAARLVAKLHAEFGVVLPLAILLEAPTVETLAAKIDAARSVDTQQNTVAAAHGAALSLLVRLNTGTDPSLAPFFVVGGAMGNVLNLRHLARICDPERDFYGIQARGLAGEAEPHRSIVDAAEAYLEQVRRVQPRGPYYMGGFCIGGVAALEMARILRADGEQVALIAMLDSHLPEVRGKLNARDRVQIQLERLREGRLDYIKKWATEKYRQSLVPNRKHPMPALAPTQYRSQLVHEAIMYARSAYQPDFYDGHIVVFRPPLAPRHYLSGGRVVNRDRGFLREDNGWRRAVRSLEIHELTCPPGEHDGFVLEPYVRELAQRLAPFLGHTEAPDDANTTPPELVPETRATA